SSPGATSKVTRSTATVSPKWRDSSRTSMAWAGVIITPSVLLLVEQCDVGRNARLERESRVGDDLHLHGIHELHALLVCLHVARRELGLARDVHDAAVECGAGMAVAGDVGGLTEGNAPDAVFADVDADPAVVGIHQRDDGLTGADG